MKKIKLPVIKVNSAAVRKILPSVIRIAAIVIIVVGGIILGSRLLGKTRLSNVTDSLSIIRHSLSSSGDFPYELEKLNNRMAETTDDEIVILRNDKVDVISSRGVNLFSRQTASEKTRIRTMNGRFILIDDTEDSVTLMSRTESLDYFKVPDGGDIYTAALSANGCVAYAYSGASSTSTVTVCKSSSKPVFSWNCSNERVTDMSLSCNGKRIAISVVGAKNAVIYSRVLLFDVNKSSPLADIPLEGTFLSRVSLTSSGRIIAVGDNKICVYNKDGNQLSEIAYSEDTLSHCAVDDKGNTLVTVNEFGGSKSRIIRIRPNGKTAYDITLDGGVDCADISGAKAVVLIRDEVRVIRSSGESYNIVETASSPDRLLLAGSVLYTVEGGQICKY